MARPCSLDLRARVVAAVEAGLPRAEVMRLFGVGRSTVRRLLKARRECASLEPKRSRPGPAGQLAGSEAPALLRAQLAAEGDARIEDHRCRWREAGRPAGSSPTRWRAPRGQRACGQAPCNRGRNTTLLAAMTQDGLLASMTVEGAANAAVFLTYLDKVLRPALRPGQVVVLDNLSVHKNAAMRQRVEAAGCRLLFLPTYSPDFNPIEAAFSKLKGYLRRAAARSPRSPGGRHHGGLGHHPRQRRPRLVQTLRLPSTGSTRVKMGVSEPFALG